MIVSIKAGSMGGGGVSNNKKNAVTSNILFLWELHVLFSMFQ